MGFDSAYRNDLLEKFKIFGTSKPVAEEDRNIEVSVRLADPVVAKLILMIADRSNAGAEEYGNKSVVDSFEDPSDMIEEAIEEAVDQVIYLYGALKLMSKKD